MASRISESSKSGELSPLQMETVGATLSRCNTVLQNGVWNFMVFQTVSEDTNGFSDASKDEFIIPAGFGGIYLFEAASRMIDAAAPALIGTRILFDGGLGPQILSSGGNPARTAPLSFVRRVAAGVAIKVQAYQNAAAAALNDSDDNFFQLWRLGNL